MGRSLAASQLALWVGHKGKGMVRLRWGGEQLVLHMSGLQVVAVEGDDKERLSAAFGLTDGGEWFTEAKAAVAAGQVSQAESNAVVKRALAERLREFLLAADAEVHFDNALQVDDHGLTISYPHLIVELMLGSAGEELVPVFLPDPSLVLRCLPDFARRVGALGLTEEAVAILAKINNQRTAHEIADPSPHGREVALRLLAAAVGAGLAEATPGITDVPLVSTHVPRFDIAPRRRRIWPFVLLAAAVVAGAALLLLSLPWEATRMAGGGGPWAVAVDGGCQPAELERLYRRQEQDKLNYRVVPFGKGDEQCYRLVWGHFPSREAAEDAVSHLPGGTVARGFPPHVVRVETPEPPSR